MKNSEVYITSGTGNWIKLYNKANNEEDFFTLSNVLSKMPVVSYSKSDGCNYLSLYYYDRLVELLEKKFYKVFVDEDIPVRFERLKRRIASKSSPAYKKPILWTDDPTCQLYEYQKDVSEHAFDRLRYILALDMGTGKTPIAISVMLTAFEQGYKKALVVCLSSLKYQWRDEIFKFTKLKEEDVLILGDKDVKCLNGHSISYKARDPMCKKCDKNYKCKFLKTDVKNRRRHQIYNTDAKITIMNYELIAKNEEQIKNAGYDIYILDEATKLKNHTSKMSRSFVKIAKKLKPDDIFIPMSGTIIENSIQEFYPVYSMIDGAIFGSWTNFKNYFLYCDFFGKPVGVNHENELRDITAKFFIRKTLDQVWKDRPKLYEITRFCSMSKIQLDIYRKAAMQKLQDMGGIEQNINTAQMAVLIAYLIMLTDTVESIMEIGKGNPDEYSCKIAMLKDIMLNEIGCNKAVVFCKYANRVIPIISREMKKCGIKHHIVTGSTDSKLRNDIINKFKTDGSRMLLCSDTLGYGVNLQFVKYMINFDLAWNPAILDQRTARVYRTGQKDNVTVMNLVTKDSVEDMILEKIYSKREMFDTFVGAGVKPESVLNKVKIKDIMRGIDEIF